MLNGWSTAASADWTLWGAALGGGAYVARSAIGQDAASDLIYAAVRNAEALWFVSRSSGLALLAAFSVAVVLGVAARLGSRAGSNPSASHLAPRIGRRAA